ncbi:Hypothetical predicted protein [Drosophila guanche]|nr:Hypothetical predicted protein [Drosophila guanche]
MLLIIIIDRKGRWDWIASGVGACLRAAQTAKNADGRSLCGRRKLAQLPGNDYDKNVALVLQPCPFPCLLVLCRL